MLRSKYTLQVGAAGRGSPQRSLSWRAALPRTLCSWWCAPSCAMEGLLPVGRYGRRPDRAVAQGQGAPVTERHATEAGVAGPLRVTTRNARFQQWESLLGNRAKRSEAVSSWSRACGPSQWLFSTDGRSASCCMAKGGPLSGWARQTLDSVAADIVAVAPELSASWR